MGEEQCRTLAASLKRAMRDINLPPPEVIVTSPLARALETTQLGVAHLFPSVRTIVLEGLREQLTGKDKNKRHTKEWIEQTFPAFDTAKVDADDLLGSTYASSKEPDEDLWQRVRSAFQYVFENFPDALVIALMSHCYVEKIIQCEITGYDIPEKDRKNKIEFFVGETGRYAIIVKGRRK
jgi:broad specificity phosphatase PhoE